MREDALLMFFRRFIRYKLSFPEEKKSWLIFFVSRNWHHARVVKIKFRSNEFDCFFFTATAYSLGYLLNEWLVADVIGKWNVTWCMVFFEKDCFMGVYIDTPSSYRCLFSVISEIQFIVETFRLHTAEGNNFHFFTI